MVQQLTTKQKVKRLIDIFNKTEEIIMVVMLSIMVILVFLQVIMRYVFNNSLTWTEELARYMFIWVSWLGISIGAQRNEHITIDVVVDRFKGKARIAILTFADLCTLAILFALAYFGVILTGQIFGFGTVSTVLKIPMWIIYVCLPVSCALMMVRVAAKMIYRIMGKEEQ